MREETIEATLQHGLVQMVIVCLLAPVYVLLECVFNYNKPSDSIQLAFQAKSTSYSDVLELLRKKAFRNTSVSAFGPKAAFRGHVVLGVASYGPLDQFFEILWLHRAHVESIRRSKAIKRRGSR